MEVEVVPVSLSRLLILLQQSQRPSFDSITILDGTVPERIRLVVVAATRIVSMPLVMERPFQTLLKVWKLLIR
jgi:hypothetical protein